MLDRHAFDHGKTHRARAILESAASFADFCDFSLRQVRCYWRENARPYAPPSSVVRWKSWQFLSWRLRRRKKNCSDFPLTLGEAFRCANQIVTVFFIIIGSSAAKTEPLLLRHARNVSQNQESIQLSSRSSVLSCWFDNNLNILNFLTSFFHAIYFFCWVNTTLHTSRCCSKLAAFNFFFSLFHYFGQAKWEVTHEENSENFDIIFF